MNGFLHISAFSFYDLIVYIPVIIVFALIFYGVQTTKIKISKDTLHLLGLYGEKIDLKEIQSVELTDNLPLILVRANGLGLGPIRKGYFVLEHFGLCKLLTDGMYFPYLIITTIKGKKIILNNKNTELIYSLKQAIQDYIRGY